MADKSVMDVIERRRLIASQIIEKTRELDELKLELAKADALLAAWSDFFGDDLTPQMEADIRAAQSARDPIDGGGWQSATKPKNPPKERIAELAREIIQARGKPVSRRGIFAYLEDKGIRLQGSDPLMVLSTMLWRQPDKVVRLGTKGYWLTEVPYPELDYHPLTEEIRAQYAALKREAETMEGLSRLDATAVPSLDLLEKQSQLLALERRFPQLVENAFD